MEGEREVVVVEYAAGRVQLLVEVGMCSPVQYGGSRAEKFLARKLSAVAQAAGNGKMMSGGLV